MQSQKRSGCSPQNLSQNLEKMPPPPAPLKGDEAQPLTAKPNCAGSGVTRPLNKSQPADPLSPAPTSTVIPSAAACSHRVLWKAFPVVPRNSSHSPKPTLKTSPTVLSTTYNAEMVTPVAL